MLSLVDVVGQAETIGKRPSLPITFNCTQESVQLVEQQSQMDVIRTTKNCLHGYIKDQLQFPSAVQEQSHVDYSNPNRSLLRQESL